MNLVLGECSYTLRKCRACGSDLAQHSRDRIDQGPAICSRMASPATGIGMRSGPADGLCERHRTRSSADEMRSGGTLRVGSAAGPSCRPTRLRCRTQPRDCYAVCQRTVPDGRQRHRAGPRDELGPHGALSNRAHRKLPNGVQIALPSKGLPGVAVASRCRARGATRAWAISRLAIFLG